jgi:hypothetical protein
MESCRQLLNEVCSCGCRTPENDRDVKIQEADLESLKRYEKALKKQLDTIQQRVKALKATQ